MNNGPYIVTTSGRAFREPGTMSSDRPPMRVLSRRAVATLDEACPECHGHGQPQGDGSGWDGANMHTPACALCGGNGFDLPESGGTITLSDGTVEVEATTWYALTDEVDLSDPGPVWTNQRILDAWNARQESR